MNMRQTPMDSECCLPAIWQGPVLNHNNSTQPRTTTEAVRDHSSLQTEGSQTLSGRSRFHHTPLKLLPDTVSIRLVEIAAPAADGLVRCRMRQVDVDSQVLMPDDQHTVKSYTCLSYVWGTGRMRTILVNDKLYEVRQNLWDLLHVLSLWKARDETKRSRNFSAGFDQESCTGCLWIDALCINQDDLAERNQQVQQMGLIYAKAHQVLSWFGRDPFVASIFQLIRYHANTTARPEPEDRILAHARKILNFGNHDYWKRAWITQEVYLAQDLYLLAETEMLAIDTIQQVAASTRETYGRMLYNQLWRNLHTVRDRDKTATLLENIWRFRNKMSSDPRDLVYSLLYISKDGWRCKVYYDAAMPYLALVILSLREDGICLCRIRLVLQALQLDEVYPSDALEDSFPKIRIVAYRLLQNDQWPDCACCNTRLIWDDVLTDVRSSNYPAYLFCLECDHRNRSVEIEIHPKLRFGHIIMIWTALSSCNDDPSWCLLWVPVLNAAREVPIIIEQNIGTDLAQFVEAVETISVPLKVIAEIADLMDYRQILTDEAVPQLAGFLYRPKGYFSWETTEDTSPPAYRIALLQRQQQEEEEEKWRREHIIPMFPDRPPEYRAWMKARMTP